MVESTFVDKQNGPPLVGGRFGSQVTRHEGPPRGRSPWIPWSSRARHHQAAVFAYDEAMSIAKPVTTPAPFRLGVVSFLNTLPLIDGIEQVQGLELRYTVPSLLIDLLTDREVDLALCSSIDYQRSAEPLLIVPVGLLGCDGATLTVRLYSAVPTEAITTVHCDTDSHTSIALMRILLDEQYGIQPQLVEYDAREHVANNKPLPWPETMLLIGDKVVTDSPPAVRYPHQLDLGAAWKDLTGLPFVFATWLARRDVDEGRLATAAAILDRQRRHNVERLNRIVHESAEPRKWPRDLARSYLTDSLNYAFTPQHRQALGAFFEMAHALGLIEANRPLQFFEP